MSQLLTCRELVCRLGGQLVLDGLDLDVAEGEAVGLLGASGNGKSTLLRMIAGLEAGYRGEIVLSDTKATADGRVLVPPHRRGVSMLFQDLALWPNLTVQGNVALGLAGLTLPRHELRQRIEHVLASCGIADLARRRPGTLSGGQQQRVALARALAMRPKLLLLDEPLGGLDLLTKRSLLAEILRLKAELGFAMILVTHDPVEVDALCDSLAILEHGRIAERGTVAQVATQPQSALATALVAALPREERRPTPAGSGS